MVGKVKLMCGFTAIFQNKKNISENHEIIKQMCETINHRVQMMKDI